MRRFFLILLLIAPLAAHAAPPAAAPTRIVSLKPSITDVVVALGEASRLVGVTKYCDLPAGTPKPAIAGDYTQPYNERIIALAPDLVLGSEENASRRSIEELWRMGVRVELFPFTTLAQTLASVRGIGAAMGMPEKGAALAARMEGELAALKKRTAAGTPLRVVAVWGTRPLVVAGPGTYLDELLPFAGATNAVVGTKIAYPRLGLEELIALDPDAIVDLSMGSEASESGGKPWEGVAALKAVREHRVVALDATLFRAGPRLPEGLALLAKMLHK